MGTCPQVLAFDGHATDRAASSVVQDIHNQNLPERREGQQSNCPAWGSWWPAHTSDTPATAPKHLSCQLHHLASSSRVGRQGKGTGGGRGTVPAANWYMNGRGLSEDIVTAGGAAATVDCLPVSSAQKRAAYDRRRRTHVGVMWAREGGVRKGKRAMRNVSATRGCR